MADTTAAATEVAVKAFNLNAPTDAMDVPGARLRAFTVALADGTFPGEGVNVDLSGLFENKVLFAVVGPVHDPAATTGDLAYLTVLVPSATGDPATNTLHIYIADDGEASVISDDSETVDDMVCHGFAIGY